MILTKGVHDKKKNLKCPKMLQKDEKKNCISVFSDWTLLKICTSFSVMTFEATKNFLKLFMLHCLPVVYMENDVTKSLSYEKSHQNTQPRMSVGRGGT